MIWSVSTLLRRSGSAVPAWRVKDSIWRRSSSGRRSARGQVGGAGEVADDCRRGGDRDRDQVRAATLALPPLEVAVRRRGAALPGSELVGVHPEAHRAAGAAPLRTRGGEDLVEALGLRLQPDPHRAGYDEQA